MSTLTVEGTTNASSAARKRQPPTRPGGGGHDRAQRRRDPDGAAPAVGLRRLAGLAAGPHRAYGRAADPGFGGDQLDLGLPLRRPDGPAHHRLPPGQPGSAPRAARVSRCPSAWAPRPAGPGGCITDKTAMTGMHRARRPLGARNRRFEDEGAFTGEVSPAGRWASPEISASPALFHGAGAPTGRNHACAHRALRANRLILFAEVGAQPGAKKELSAWRTTI